MYLERINYKVKTLTKLKFHQMIILHEEKQYQSTYKKRKEENVLRREKQFFRKNVCSNEVKELSEANNSPNSGVEATLKAFDMSQNLLQLDYNFLTDNLVKTTV